MACSDTNASIGRTIYNPSNPFPVSKPVAIAKMKTTLANMTIRIADTEICTAHKDATLEELKDWLKAVETDHQQLANKVQICLYMDSLTYMREIKLLTAAVRAYLSDEAGNAYVCGLRYRG